jgi:hypothetical protein
VACVSPEQVEGAGADGRADLYALGCVLFHLLTGREVFPAAEPHEIAFRHLTADPPAARALRPCVPAELDALLTALLTKDPDDRPATAAAVAEDLRAIAHRHRQRQTFCRTRSTALLAEAERTADTIAHPLERAEALCDIARILLRRDPARASRLLTRAEQAANTSTHEWARNGKLADIAGVLAEWDPAEAERVADAIAGFSARNGARLRIVRSLLERDPVEAERVAGTIAYDKDEFQALLEIAAALIGDLEDTARR